MKRTTFLSISLNIIFLLTLLQTNAQNKDQLFQVGTVNALLAGAYDGIMETEELHSSGNFGLGTFDKLDGEMIVYEGNIYQVRYDGKVIKNDVPALTPFAAVVNFNSDEHFEISSIDSFENLVKVLSNKIENRNLPSAVEINGTFEYVKVRSVPAQKKPYPTLAEAAKEESVFEYENIEGTLIGFFMPEYFKSFNVPGLHVHFLSLDEMKGGHLLDLKLKKGISEIDILNEFYVYLPDDSDHFKNLDLNKDRSEELENVER